MEILLIIVAVVLCLLVIMQFRLMSRSGMPSDTGSMMMQQQLESLRSDFRNSLQNISNQVDYRLTDMTQHIQSQTNTVGNRLDHAARLMGDVQKDLGTLGQATQEMKDLGQNMLKLEELLSAPKLRGGLGEYLLEDLLKQVLPTEHITMQHRFRNGNIVDAVIHTSDRFVPVDAKFPLENFRRMLSDTSDVEKKTFRKAFVADVKKHIDAIATKYILPDEGTFPFALMYIPAENIYYEIIIKHDNIADAGLYQYAIEKKVIPV